ncbi:unnamed protein product [Polarella glacialis]|uniref:EF-hand domain-containing protein n=1 Tax=Polarella glacialis TaxID=89957 RepID=A0A813HHA7_POLGL|nr:unnamed protein product [Polarella glacialis]|mmetsp:Transcript_43475/g.70457  ORF Transcript_43475/g.70457 Transcript_43475/m.70457 type:complete len:225 (+) Transcript_43475:88-762(+)
MQCDYTSEEAEKLLVSRFASWDVDQSGFISKAELKNVLVRLGMRGADVDKVFHDMDSNRDNGITYQEFVTYIMKGCDTVAVAMDPVAAAKSVDVAIDHIIGFIEQKKQEQIQKEVKTKSTENGLTVVSVSTVDTDKTLSEKDIFKLLDLNANGTISITEFISGLRSLKIGDSRPITEHLYPDNLLKGVFNMIDQARKKNGKMEKDHALTYKEFKAFLAEKGAGG